MILFNIYYFFGKRKSLFFHSLKVTYLLMCLELSFYLSIPNVIPLILLYNFVLWFNCFKAIPCK